MHNAHKLLFVSPQKRVSISGLGIIQSNFIQIYPKITTEGSAQTMTFISTATEVIPATGVPESTFCTLSNLCLHLVTPMALGRADCHLEWPRSDFHSSVLCRVQTRRPACDRGGSQGTWGPAGLSTTRNYRGAWSQPLVGALQVRSGVACARTWFTACRSELPEKSYLMRPIHLFFSLSLMMSP